MRSSSSGRKTFRRKPRPPSKRRSAAAPRHCCCRKARWALVSACGLRRGAALHRPVGKRPAIGRLERRRPVSEGMDGAAGRVGAGWVAGPGEAGDRRPQGFGPGAGDCVPDRSRKAGRHGRGRVKTLRFWNVLLGQPGVAAGSRLPRSFSPGWRSTKTIRGKKSRVSAVGDRRRKWPLRSRKRTTTSCGFVGRDPSP